MSYSRSGWLFVYEGSDISHKKRKTYIANFTLALKYISLARTSHEVKWLKNLKFKIPLLQNSIFPMKIHTCMTALETIYSQVDIVNRIIYSYCSKTQSCARMYKRWVCDSSLCEHKFKDDFITKAMNDSFIEQASI